MRPVANSKGVRIEAPKALSVSRLRGLGERRELSQQDLGQRPGQKRIYHIFLSYRTLLADRKMQFFSQSNAYGLLKLSSTPLFSNGRGTRVSSGRWAGPSLAMALT